MNIKIRNEFDNVKEIKLGFSWTMFFFGVFVPLVRGDWKYFFIITGVALVLTIISMGFLGGLTQLVFCFVYNKLYARDLYEQGYRGLSKGENDLLRQYIK